MLIAFEVVRQYRDFDNIVSTDQHSSLYCQNSFAYAVVLYRNFQPMIKKAHTVLNAHHDVVGDAFPQEALQ